MSDRHVSDELADAIISMVQECQVREDEDWTSQRTESAKRAIADVMDLLEVEIVKRIAKAIEEAKGGYCQ